LAKEKNIAYEVGDDKTIEVTLDPVPADITGWAITAIVKTSDAAAAASITKTVGAGITITDGPNAIFEIFIADTDVDGLSGTLRWKVKRTDSGAEHTLVYGDFKIISVPTDV
jgi:hypothetical protein